MPVRQLWTWIGKVPSYMLSESERSLAAAQQLARQTHSRLSESNIPQQWKGQNPNVFGISIRRIRGLQAYQPVELEETRIPISSSRTMSQRTAEPNRFQGVLNAFEKTCQRWNLDEDEQKILLGGQPGVSSERQSFVRYRKVVSRDMKDRVGYIVAISLGLGILFDENSELERRWLNRSLEKLQGKSPLAYMLEGGMKNLITVNDIVEKERGL